MILSLITDLIYVVATVILIFLVAISINVVDKDEVLLVRRRSKYKVFREGLRFLLPFVDKKIGRYSLCEQQKNFSFTNIASKTKSITAFIYSAYYISEFVEFYKNPNHLEKIKQFLNDLLTNFVSKHNSESLDDVRDELNDLLYTEADNYFASLGLKLNQIYFYYE